MVKRPTDRRAVLIAAGAAALAAAAGTAAAQGTDIRGTVTFRGGAAIPEGRIAIYLEDLAIQDQAQRRLAEAHLTSDGRAKVIGFSVPGPDGLTAAPSLQIVARLARADGWLIARGSAQITAQAPVDITLNAVTY